MPWVWSGFLRLRFQAGVRQKGPSDRGPLLGRGPLHFHDPAGRVLQVRLDDWEAGEVVAGAIALKGRAQGDDRSVDGQNDQPIELLELFRGAEGLLGVRGTAGTPC